MYSFILFALSLAVYTNGAFLDGHNGCKKYECPNFTPVNKTMGVEFRAYDPYSFASIFMKGNDYYRTVYKMYGQLQNYFNGDNDQGVKIPKTFPYIKSFSSRKGMGNGETYGFHFFIPKTFAKNIPKPNNPEIKIFSTSSPETMAVLPFYGFSTPENIHKHQQILMKKLEAMNVEYFGHKFYASSYSTAGVLKNRYNEVTMSLFML